MASSLASSAAGAVVAPRATSQRAADRHPIRRASSTRRATPPGHRNHPASRGASIRRAAVSVDPNEGGDGPTRREALIGLAAAALTPAFLYGATESEREGVALADEPVPLAAALRAQTVYAGFCIPIIETVVTAPFEDLMALAIRDAGSFDAKTGRGGLNGSIRFELDRPENRRFVDVVKQLERAKRAIDEKATAPIGWADLIALAPVAKARYQFLRDFCGVTPRFEPRWQYKAGDINIVGCDYDRMLTPPFGATPEQIEATSWFRQNYAGVGPLTGQRVHMGRADATEADPESLTGSVPRPGASAETYVAWFRRQRLSLPALVNLAPFVDETCEATLRNSDDADLKRLFAEIDNKSYAPGYKEKPLIKSFRELTLRGPAEFADQNAYVSVEAATGEAVAAIPLIEGRRIKSVKQLMDAYVDPLPVWIM